ncbi:MAG TPA: hypothetical protein VNZ49_03535 [Bacteroidia bacterium]|jgi:hypothetical protein|nr:hypothetical protein [Bacteroidia bacterium]
MKNFSFFCLLLIASLSCCTNAEKPKETSDVSLKKDSLVSELDTFYIGQKLFTVFPASKEDFDKIPEPVRCDTSEKNNLFKDSAFVTRLGGTLILNCKDKETIVFKNNPKEGYEEYADYTYLGKIPDINQYLILGSFHESFSYLLVNPLSGDTTFICGEPVFSPDKKYFICGNTDLIAAFVINGFDLYEINGKKIKLVGRRELSKWGPEKIKWIDNSSLLIERSVLDTTKQEMTRTDYIKLILK